MATASASVLAFVATVHVAILLLLAHRKKFSGGERLLLVPSFFCVASPWLLPGAVWIGVCIAVHAAWFVACEKLVPERKSQAAMVPAKPTPPAALSPEPSHGSAPERAPSPPNDFQMVPVLAVFDENREIRTFRLSRPEGFVFTPGQFLMVKLVADGKPQVRCYSISSAPECSGYLEISVRKQGLVSSTLHATVRPGSLLAIKGPGGHFVYPVEDSRPIVLLAGGVGITPLISMLRHAVAAEPSRPVTLLCSFRGELGVPFEEELALLSRRHPQGRVAVTLTGEQNSRYLTGRIDGRMIRDYVLDPEHSLFCLCGPAAMIDGLRRELREIGIPDPQVRFEAFEAAIAASKSVAAPAAKALTGPRAPRNGLALRLSLSGKSVCLAPGQTLLDAAEAGGVEIPSLCRAGACGTCKTKLVSGNVDFSSDSLHPEDRKQGYVFPCVATAKSDCTLEL